MLIALVIVVVAVVVVVALYNKIKIAQVKVEEGASGIDVALAKRYDTLTNLMECVKGYAAHETNTLKQIVEIRKRMTMSEKSNCENSYQEMQTKLFAIAEGYPELKASDNFLQLQKSIFDVEEHLQAARRLYNANVASYNQLIVVFPSNLMASLMNAKREDFFQANQDEKTNVNIQL